MRLEFNEQDRLGNGAVVAAPRAEAPVSPAACPPLSFDMPRPVLGTLVGLAAGYVAVMALAFGGGNGLGVIFVVFAVTLVGFYGLPWLLARVSGGLGPDCFARRGAWGLDTASGYLSGYAAMAQLYTVPALMLAWAVFVLALV